MYAPRGHGLSEVGDVEVVADGDQIHLFHLTLPNHDLVQHAVSDDGLAWRPLPAALRTGDPGDGDDDQIWTASVTPDPGGGWAMLYTALATRDDGMVQRTGLAHSSDLVHWRKAGPEPIAAADPRWYEADPAVTGRVSWRDPKPIPVGDVWYAAVCAREREGPLARRGCVGLMASPDLASWEVQPPLFAPRHYWDLECPQVFRLGEGGPFYLTAAIMEDRSQRYWMAERFEGPYQTPADGGILAPAGHYAGRVCRWHGDDLFFCWHRTNLAAGWMATSATVDWVKLRNPFGKFVVPPLALSARPDGTLTRRSFPGWDRYREGEPSPIDPAPRSLFRARPTAEQGWRAATESGVDVLATAAPFEDVLLEGTLVVEAAAGGLAFRLDDEGGGYFVALRAGSDEIGLEKWLIDRDPRDGHLRERYVELQRGRLAQPATRGARLAFQLLVVGQYLEVAIDGDVVLAELSAERTTGPLGIWVDSGSVHLEGPRLTAMRRPQHG